MSEFRFPPTFPDFAVIRRHATATDVHPGYVGMLQEEMLVLLKHIDDQHGVVVRRGEAINALAAEAESLKEKWEFEHALAIDLQTEIERLDAEIDSLRRDLEDDGTHAKVTLTGPELQPPRFAMERTTGHLGVAQPSYIVPPADPLLAKPEKHR